MRPAVIWLLSIAALATAQTYEEPWAEEESEYNEENAEIETHERHRREAYVEDPYEEHIRVKRRCYDEPEPRYRVRREYVRVPRQVHQYEVHEFTDDSSPSSPPFEEMLAASAEHYHRVYGAPGAPASARYLNPDGHTGYNTHHHVDKGAQGHKTDELHRKEYEEAAGKRRKHHDKAGHQGSHEEEAFGQRGSNFDEKKGHKKGHKSKGYHNKYHKDEFHKEHKFYDDFHKSGEHHRFGKFNAKHASNESGKKKAHHVNAGHDIVERGKKGYSNKGHLDENHTGHKGGHGHDEHHAHQSQYGKKGGKEGGSHWGHQQKH